MPKLKTITDRMFLKDKDFVLVNIQLLTVKDLNEIEVVLNETGKGKSFGNILKSRGKTDPLVNENGEQDNRQFFLVTLASSQVNSI